MIVRKRDADPKANVIRAAKNYGKQSGMLKRHFIRDM